VIGRARGPFFSGLAGAPGRWPGLVWCRAVGAGSIPADHYEAVMRFAQNDNLDEAVMCFAQGDNLAAAQNLVDALQVFFRIHADGVACGLADVDVDAVFEQAQLLQALDLFERRWG
jgi:hypothetical protein